MVDVGSAAPNEGGKKRTFQTVRRSEEKVQTASSDDYRVCFSLSLTIF